MIPFQLINIVANQVADAGPVLSPKDQLIDTLSTAGIWAKLDTFFLPISANDITTGSEDWKRSGISATYHGETTWNPVFGFMGNDASGWVDTEFTPSTDAVNLSTNDCSYFVYVGSKADAGVNAGLFGASDFTNEILMGASFDYGQVGGKINSNGSTKNNGIFNYTYPAFLCAARNAASSTLPAIACGIYHNGILASDYGNDNSSSGLATNSIALGAWMLGVDSTIYNSNAKIMAFGAGSYLTPSEQQQIQLAIDVYIDALPKPTVTLDQNNLYSDLTITSNNLLSTSGGNNFCKANTGAKTGKFYHEVTYVSAPGSGGGSGVGKWLAKAQCHAEFGQNIDQFAYKFDGSRYVGGTLTGSYGPTITPGDTLGCAVDLDAKKIWWSKNGTWINGGDPETGTNPNHTYSYDGDLFPTIATGNNTLPHQVTALFSGFNYTPPTGFSAW